MLFSSHGFLTYSLTISLLAGATVADDARARAEDAFRTLQTWYNPSTGLWDTAGWWNCANVMTVVADLALVDPSVMENASYIFNNTLIMAPAQNPQPGPEVKVNSARDLSARVNQAVNASQWLDSAYDDDGWWALAWIAAYDVTEDNQYLQLAEGIFDGLTKAWGTRCSNGGIPWNPSNDYVNAITNELFLSTAAHLANRVPSKKDYYVDWAQKEWNWFLAQDFIGENNTINDGLLDNCQNNGATVWSYNQGVVLGGLVELNKAAPNKTYLGTANAIAEAAIETLTDSNKVLHDSCEPDNCEPDATQFKGIFIRNLEMLQRASPRDIYREVIISSADSIWNDDRNGQGQLGVDWAGPLHDPADATTHSCAMEALVAAISV
ncbi:Six-hairpin glycosidase [Penicillium sp. IBT 18751x]|nr:Six-hairpin glycosidase [Penicillium sp. IBT 18751x]